MQIVERQREVGAAPLGLDVQHLADHPERPVLALLRRHEALDPVGEQDQPDLVVVADGAQREQRAQFGRDLGLELGRAAEPPRRAEVDQQHHGQLALLDVALDERMADARGDVPVDRADVVARHVLADVGELDAAALEHAVVLAGERAIDQAAGPDVDPPDLSQRFEAQHRAADAQGTGRWSNTCWIRSSALTPAASAS